MTNPFILDVHDLLNEQTTSEHIQTSGDSPLMLGGDMLGIAQGAPVRIDATVTNLGEAVMVDAGISGTATGTCSRCLQDLTVAVERSVNQVFSTQPIVADDDEDADEQPPLIVDETIDLTQAVVDEFGLNVPFSPTCDQFGQECLDSTPAPDGVSEEVEEEEKIDPRWAGLQKFLED